jgi:hypothetical protein
LACPYCGTITEANVDASGAVVENDLAQALRNIGDEQRGWQAERQSVRCQSCQAITLFDPAKVAARCDFCGSPSLIPLDATQRIIRPTGLLEFRLDATQVRDRIRLWYGSHFWAPNSLKRNALTDTVRGVYVPYWTFDSQAYADWSALSGYHYWETETYQDANGNQQTRQVQKTRWSPSTGSVEHFFDDELIPGTKGVRTDLLRSIEPFPTTTDLRPYDPIFLAGWDVEQYQLDLVGAASAAREAMKRKLHTLCAQQVPGDTHRDLRVNAIFRREAFKHVIVPIWLLSYNVGPKTYQVVINGCTGKIAGECPLSWIKITIAVLLICILVLVFFLATQR